MFRKSLTALVTSIKKETDDGIPILTDMPADSPFNVGAQLALQFRQVSVLSGINFPMVLTALEMAGEPLDNILSQMIETGRSAIDSFKEIVIAEEKFFNHGDSFLRIDYRLTHGQIAASWIGLAPVMALSLTRVFPYLRRARNCQK